MADANALLRRMREAASEWRDAGYLTGAEQAASLQLVEAFAELDEHLQDGGELPAEWDISAEVPYEAKARALVREGKKIHAIKEVRAATGWTLREAKDYVDRLDT